MAGRGIEYVKHKYSNNHWSVCTESLRKFGICVVRCHYRIYVVLLHPLDRTSYRLIVRIYSASNKTIRTTFNRESSTGEIHGLFEVLGKISNMLSDQGLFGQVLILGSNSSTFNKETGKTILGLKEEPHFLHGHIFFRGNPKYEYISGVPLEGIEPGRNLQIASKKSKLYTRISWNDKELQSALAYFKQKILNLKDEWDLEIATIDDTKPFEVSDYIKTLSKL